MYAWKEAERINKMHPAVIKYAYQIVRKKGILQIAGDM